MAIDEVENMKLNPIADKDVNDVDEMMKGWDDYLHIILNP